MVQRLISLSTVIVIAGLVWTAGAVPALAQLNTQHLKGATGLKSGSQPPPHTYVIAPLLFVYKTDKVKDRDGDTVPIDASISSVAYGAGINMVTETKLLGANYGFQVLFPVGANNRIQGTEIDANPGAGLTDSVISPVSLGWHFKRADAIAGYTMFVPTGRYTDGAANNTGFGMWGHEVSVGTTVYLNEARQYHVATLASFDFQSKKEDSETKVGNVMILEGGGGGDFLKGGLTVGLNYYTAFKLTEDRIEGLPQILIRGKNKTFALGPEVQLALARKGMLYGFVKVNYQWETYARVTTQGSALTVLATFLVKPLKLPTQ
ncbi:MAG TPA: transporter [Vicinamibacterales bacterium]|nr:transporter [Vicinamibacterales bacterium]